jgi:hypothetical protein
MHTWKNDYENIVAAIVAGQRDINLDELAARLDMMRDEVESLTARLIERGVIHELNA